MLWPRSNFSLEAPEQFHFIEVLASPYLPLLVPRTQQEGDTVDRLLEDLAMGSISKLSRRCSQRFDHLLGSLYWKSGHPYRFARGGIRRLSKLRSKLRSVAGRMAAEIVPTSR